MWIFRRRITKSNARIQRLAETAMGRIYELATLRARLDERREQAIAVFGDPQSPSLDSDGRDWFKIFDEKTADFPHYAELYGELLDAEHTWNSIQAERDRLRYHLPQTRDKLRQERVRLAARFRSDPLLAVGAIRSADEIEGLLGTTADIRQEVNKRTLDHD